MEMSTQPALSTVERLLAIEEIKRVQYKYAYSADHHNWDDFASSFAPDAVFDEHDFPIARKPGTNEPVPSATPHTSRRRPPAPSGRSSAATPFAPRSLAPGSTTRWFTTCSIPRST